MKTIRGQVLRESDYADIEKQLKELFRALIFKPMIDLLAPHSAQVKAAAKGLRNSAERRNAAFDPIVAGINSGRIQYVGEAFTGIFSAAISRALRGYGAKFNKATKAFTALPQQLPVEVLEAAKAYADAAKAVHDRLDAQLAAAQKALESDAAIHIDGSKTIKGMDKSFDDRFGDALGTEGLSDAAKAALARRYEDSVRPYVKEFTDKMILELRGIVADNARAGHRFDRLVDGIQGRYDVSQSKAAFLARNETARFVAEHRRQRFGDAGVTSYVWSTSKDSRVREDHKKLDGRTFEYAHPPVVDEATGRRANPGGDFLCRCVDSPILPVVLVNA